jgi:uncharacterized membrane protein
MNTSLWVDPALWAGVALSVGTVLFTIAAASGVASDDAPQTRSMSVVLLVGCVLYQVASVCSMVAVVQNFRERQRSRT